MCKANDRYWEREIGKEVICKCGKTHYKERRPKPKTCKQCLAEDNLKQLLIDADKAKRKVFRLIGVWQCTSCEIVKPEHKFTKDSRKGACGRCKDCLNRHARNSHQWVTPKENVEQTRLLNLSKKRTDVHLILCPDCDTYEVRKHTKYVRCLCTVCYKKRDARNRHYTFALDNNGINNNIDCECRGKCGAIIPAAYGVKSVWCVPCKDEADTKQRRMKHASERRRRRGGRVHGVAYDPYAVFKRDKWRCYLCNTKTQKKDIYANDAAEIDHVIPLSKGGKDIPSNVKCCCRACNIDKSDKVIAVTGNLFCQL
jgi:hypothetical protein